MMAIEIPIPRIVSQTETRKPANDGVSQDKTQRGNRPNGPTSADMANGIAALRACRGVLEPLPDVVRSTVISSLMGEFLAGMPANVRGEILRMLNAAANMTLELLTSREPPPDNAA